MIILMENSLCCRYSLIQSPAKFNKYLHLRYKPIIHIVVFCKRQSAGCAHLDKSYTFLRTMDVTDIQRQFKYIEVEL